jgi:hypothetical protein
MSSFVLIFVPCGEGRGDVEAAFRKYVDPAESNEDPAATRAETIEDAEQMPLWRWFTF